MAEVPRAGAEEVDAAVAAAQGRLPGLARRSRPATAPRCCAASPTRSRRQAEELATLEARNAGKPIADARGEIGMVVETFRYYAGAPERLLGKTIPVAGGVDMTFREPLGVVGLIVPWNFPLVIASWKVAPALAAGNTIVLKPAELTPLTALELERIALEAGHPGGRAQRRRRARARSAASAWSSTPTSPRSPSPARPRSAAGSPRAPRTTIKRVTLELGGKSANVVFADADLEAAAAAAPMAVFGNAGQDCCARSRILVERAAMDEFMAALEARGRGDQGRRPARRGDRRWAR